MKKAYEYFIKQYKGDTELAENNESLIDVHIVNPENRLISCLRDTAKTHSNVRIVANPVICSKNNVISVEFKEKKAGKNEKTN